MKNRWQPVLFLALSLALGVLSVPGKAALELRSEFDSYPLDEESISFTVSNRNSEDISCSPYGAGDWFEVQTDSGWEKKAALPDRFFLLTAILIAPGEEEEIRIWMDNFRDDSWIPGTYRFVLSYSTEVPNPKGPPVEVYLTSNEFTLT